MKLNKQFSLLGAVGIALFASCEEEEKPILNGFTNCEVVTSFFVQENFDQDGNPITPTLGEEDLTVCGRNDEVLASRIQDVEMSNIEVEERIARLQDQSPTISSITFDEADFDFAGNSFNFGDVSMVGIIDNPDLGGTNSDASMVHQTVVDTNLGNGFNGVGFDIEAIGFEEFDFTGDNKQITVSVWSNVPFTFQAQISDGRDADGVDIIEPRPAFKTAEHTGSGWEDLVFDFSTGPLFNPFLNNNTAPGGGSEISEADFGQISGQYNRVQFQFNGVPSNTVSTFYIDNIEYISSSGAPAEPSLMITYDEADFDFAGNSFNFGDVSMVGIIDNPDLGGTNSNASMVHQTVVDTNLGNGFNGVGFDIEAIGFEEFDFTGDNKQITVSVWSNVPFTFQAQISDGRDADGVDIIEPRPAFKTAEHTGSGWEDLVFDFSTGPLFNPFLNNNTAPGGGSEISEADFGEISGNYNRIQFQFNGAPASAMTTFYIDNITYN